MASYGSWQPWIDEVTEILGDGYGLANDFAGPVAVFLAYCSSYGLAPHIQRGWTDPEVQKAMQRQWDAGNREGLRARPATDSLHTRTDWTGLPAARAVDVTTNSDGQAAAIARALGIGVGADFRDPDPGHYFDRKAR